MILYAPVINSALPAFVKQNDGNYKLRILFQHNRAVVFEPSSTDPDIAATFVIQARRLGESTMRRINLTNIEYGPGYFDATAIINDDKLSFKIGFYEMQIAYASASEPIVIGPWSTIGITKYVGDLDGFTLQVKTKADSVPLEEASTGKFNSHSDCYIGYYAAPENALSEILYDHRLQLKDTTDNIIIADSGWVMPTQGKIPPFFVESELNIGHNYELIQEAKTINGLMLSNTYNIIRVNEVTNLFNGTLEVFQDQEAFENGFVKIRATCVDTAGYFRLLRCCSNEIPKKWIELTTFSVNDDANSHEFIWKDLSIEQGIEYEYAIQQYSTTNNRYSVKMRSTSIVPDFEHIFISDGERQLRLAFNPQISSLKDVILETKIDTIGSRYPFFFSNGTVKYKEIPLSGLLSYLLDTDYFFIKNAYEVIGQRSTNLTATNFTAERKFKLEVLNWLNDGKFKLLRTPAEGNYIVRITNVSLAPNTTLGRMLHTVSATAYEGADCTMANLQQHNLIKFAQYIETPENDIFAQLTYEYEHGTLSTSSGIKSKSWDTKYVSIISLTASPENDSEEAVITLNDKQVITIPPSTITEISSILCNQIEATHNANITYSVVIGQDETGGNT